MRTSDSEPAAEHDLARRRHLRSFLFQCRARVEPVQIGLPHTGRRHVRGLRRGEVAELIGVSVDWYRAFESGRPVRVSPQFVSRLAAALQLQPPQELLLFQLAFPEMYRLQFVASGYDGGALPVARSISTDIVAKAADHALRRAESNAGPSPSPTAHSKASRAVS